MAIAEGVYDAPVAVVQRAGGEVVSLHRGRPEHRPLVAAQQHRWTRQDVAAAFGVSVSTVGRWHKRGLPHVRPYGPGGIVRYDEAKVLAWAAARDQNASGRNLADRQNVGFPAVALGG